jgi:hypothetical protein
MRRASPISELDIVAAHKHCIRNRDEVESSERCGCFYCGLTFVPAQILEWVNETNGSGQTALCPECGIDAVIGSAAGYPLTPEFLAAMHDHWF